MGNAGYKIVISAMEGGPGEDRDSRRPGAGRRKKGRSFRYPIPFFHPIAVPRRSPGSDPIDIGEIRTKILPSPISPVRAPLVMAWIVGSTNSSLTAISSFNLLQKLPTSLVPR